MNEDIFEISKLINHLTLIGAAALAYYIGKDLGAELYHLFF